MLSTSLRTEILSFVTIFSINAQNYEYQIKECQCFYGLKEESSNSRC